MASLFSQSGFTAWFIIFFAGLVYLLSTVVFCTIVKWATNGRIMLLLGILALLSGLLVVSYPTIDIMYAANQQRTKLV
jgi:prepilin signal peptidase PulO-like enzyme (type II secretory pathway)